jgi:hypothetical protein
LVEAISRNGASGGPHRLDDHSLAVSQCRCGFQHSNVIGGIPTVRNVVHLQHGELVRNGS